MSDGMKVISTGSPVVSSVQFLEQVSWESSGNKMVDDFMEIETPESASAVSFGVVPTTRLQDHLAELELGPDENYDLEEFGELEIAGGLPALRNWSWGHFASVFDRLFGGRSKNKVLWIGDTFVSSDMTMAYYGGYDMVFSSLNGTYSVFAGDDGRATETFEALLLLLSRESNEELVQINGFDENVEDLPVGGEILRLLWGPSTVSSRRLEFYAYTFSVQQVRALMEVNNGRGKALSLTTCFFQDGGVAFLDCLRQNKCPERLHLASDFSLCQHNAALFAAAIRSNSALKQLNVWGCGNCDAKTTSELLKSFRGNQGLRRLYIGGGWDWDNKEHWPLFCEVLRHHPKLQFVELGCGEFDNGHMQDLENIIFTHARLVFVRIGFGFQCKTVTNAGKDSE